MPKQSIENNVLLNDIASSLKNISTHLSVDRLSVSELIQMCAVLIALIVPFVLYFLDKRKLKLQTIQNEKEITIALSCLLLSNLNALLGYKKQLLNPLKVACDSIEYQLKAMQGRHNSDINKWMDNIRGNASTYILCSINIYANITNLSILLDKLNFLSEKEPNTFVLIHTVNAMYSQYYKASDLRNDTIHTFRHTPSNPHDFERFTNELGSIIEHSVAVCVVVDDCIKYTNDTLEKIVQYLKKSYNHNQVIKIKEGLEPLL